MRVPSGDHATACTLAKGEALCARFRDGLQGIQKISMHLFVRQVDAEAVEQCASAAFHGGDGALVADLRLQEALLGGGQLRLGVEDEENRLHAELVLALLGFEIFLREVAGDFYGIFP